LEDEGYLLIFLVTFFAGLAGGAGFNSLNQQAGLEFLHDVRIAAS